MRLHPRSIRKLWLSALGLFFLIGIAFVFMHWTRANAVTSSEWQAGSIISDDIFYDNTSMSTSDIQAFLNSLVTTCDTNGTASASDLGYPWLNHAQYAAQNGWPAPPYVCLKDYYQVPQSDTIVDNFSGTIPSGALSAAQIIKNAADAYHISPKVLLTKIRLESAGPLILDSWPLQSQYTAALGYACSDSAPCDTRYAGFYNQVTNAARQIRLYHDNASGYRHQPFQSNDVDYNPGPCKTWSSDSTCAEWYGQYKTRRDLSYCGSSNVYISNYATAGLYNYTPYQPNQAALDNLHGSGDICSTYGNRNFWVIWNDWFGPSNTPLLRSWQSGKMYIRSDSGALYYITDVNQLRDLGYGAGVMNGYVTVDDSYVATHGSSDLPALIQFSGSSEVYYYENGQLHYVSYQAYQAYGSPVVGQVSSSLKALFKIGPDATTVLRDYLDGLTYYIKGGDRRYVVGPSAYSYYKLGDIATSSASRSLIATINEGAPLAMPGTIIYANDSTAAGVVSEDGNHLYPLNKDLKASLQLATYTTTDKMVRKLPNISAPLTHLAKDSSGNLYIIDQNFKLAVSMAQKLNLGFGDDYYTTTPTLLLQQLQTREARPGANIIVRIGGDPSIYMFDGKELVLFQSYADLLSYGYTLADTITFTKRFVDTYFSVTDATVLPAGILARASNDQRVYLISTSGKKIPILTSYLFTNVGFSFPWVRVVSPRSLDRLPKVSPLAPYAIDSTGQYWLLYNGTKRLVPPAYQTNFGLPVLNDSNQVTPWQLNALPRTYNASRFIRVDSSQNVYLVEAGASHLLSLASYLSLSDNPWNDITPVSSDLFYSISIGAPRL